MQTQQVILDVLKPTGTIVDLSDSFNARVGDKMTPFQLFILEGGVAKDLKGMHPELEVVVGNGALKGNKAIMNAGAKGVHWVGSTNNVTGYNQLTLAFPAEVFPQSGFCYGHLILANDAGIRESSVDIWFQVLDGTPQMGMVADHYDSELQLELAKAKNMNDQFSQEMRAAYNQQVTDAQNALTKATANLSSLAATAGNVEAQITAQDIITRPEYNDLATKINRTLAGFDLHPESFATQADLLAKYPKGAEGLKITVDTMHKWLYINGVWTDKGPFTFNDLSPAEKAVMYSPSNDNILINPDLKNSAYGWGINGPWEKDPMHAIGNSMAYGLNLTEVSDKVYTFWQENINVEKRSIVSAGIKALTVGGISASFQVLFRDANNQIIENTDQNIVIPGDTQNQFKLVKLENIEVPKTATTAAVTVAAKGKGLIIICRPQVNCTRAVLPYSIQELHEDIDVNNLFTNPDLQYNASGWTMIGPWQEDPAHAIGNSMAYGCYLTEKPDKPAQIYQEKINIEKRSFASLGIQVLTNNATSANMQLFFKDANDQIIEDTVTAIPLPLNTLDGFETIKIENTVVPDNAVTATATITMEDKGLVVICRPQLNAERQLVPYSTRELAKTANQDHDNVLINPDLKSGANGWTYFGRWEIDKVNSINSSVAYGCYQTEKPASSSIFYQEDVSVDKKKVLSAGIEAITNSAVNVAFQVLFRDKDHNIIVGTDRSIKLPSDTKSAYQLFKLEGVPIPANAATAAVTVANADKGLVVFCRPRLNFGKKLVPYSLSELELDGANSFTYELPFFKFDMNRSVVADKWVNTKFAYQNGNQQIEGYAQIAIQGDSSRLYDKKNYKIKTFSDAECKQKLKLRLKPTWPETNKFNLKANFIDATQSRNLASAKLVAAATAITPIADKTVESHLAKTSNFGQMEGFPIEIWFGDGYNGLYTCNTKKDDKVFGLDADVAGNAAVSILDNVAQSDTQLLNIPTAKLDGIAYADELHDTPDQELVANWSKWLDFLNNSSDEDFKANLASYIDVKSAINLYLFGVMSREYDYNTKSVLYLTWNNGKYFYLIPYDLDSNWGQSADGKIEGNPTNDSWEFSTDNGDQDGKFVSNLNWNKLFERLYKLFMPEIKEQYAYLRSSVWRTDQLLNAYRDFMNQIPQSAYEKDHKLWKQIPSLKTNDYEQLHQVIVQRSNQMDRWIKFK